MVDGLGITPATDTPQTAIADVSSTDSGTGGSDATHVAAINFIIEALVQSGIIKRA